MKDVDIFLLDFFKACYFDKFKDITKVKKSNLISNFREIFQLIKLTNKKDSYQIAVEFVDKALKYLELYHELFKSEKKYQHSNYKNVNKIIVGLNLLNYKSIKPILVSMLLVNREGNYFLENEIFIFIDKLYKYYLLKLKIGGEQANFIENDFKKIMVFTLKYKLAFLKLDNNKKMMMIFFQ
ncbi:hypothetical protein [Spiroplasma endosymbiont of Eupeodes luniger]|uniref:hypothetical protein n=1 Tax=Spiroplasma endosymbiont of Eupeodes luniger TaxID=3066300 RepID=UPI0030D09E60